MRYHAALLALALAAAATPAQAQKFDGRWSVFIVTEKGECDKYRYEVEVAGGRVIYTGQGASVSGRVSPNGSVAVTVSDGSRVVKGTGRLTASRGTGRWTATVGGSCAGYWEADRR